MRLNDIRELLQDVEDNIKLIEKEYQKALTDKDIQQVMKVKVKSSLENLRSCLDYCAHDIYDIIYKAIDYKSIGELERLKIYFPYGETDVNFKASVGRTFKRLKTVNSQVYVIIESIQPFKCNNNWLVELCRITNNIKHKELIKQQRMDTKSLNINGINLIKYEGTVVNITMSGNTFNGKKQQSDIIIKNSEVVSDLNDIGLEAFFINWVRFTFNNTNIDVLKLLKISYSEIKRMIDDLYSILSK